MEAREEGEAEVWGERKKRKEGIQMWADLGTSARNSWWALG